MMDCPREAEVIDAVSRGIDVRDHLAACTSCAEIAEIAALFREDQRAALDDTHLPAAGTVWWRATIRARAEAARAVSQPITLAQGIAAACAVGLAVALCGAAWRWLHVANVADVVAGLDARRDELAAASALVLQHALPLALGLAACLVIAPLALYFALGDD